MNWLLLCRMLGMLGMLVGGSMVFSLPWAFPACGQTEVFEADGFRGLVGAIGCSLAVGGVLYWLGRNDKSPILRKEALAIVGLGWIVAGALGSLPYLFSGTLREAGLPMTVPDALFESISGFTTTGASVLTELDDPQFVPRCILFWRSFTHWLGGMGIIVLFIAVLGRLGAGGKVLMRREVPGPINEEVRPRVRETALVMWMIYVGLSALLTVILVIEGQATPVGVSWFDALCHTFGALSTGGFSTHNASVGYFQSVLVEATLVLFMLVGGTNFSLFYLVLHRGRTSGRGGWLRRLAPLYRDPEFRVYLAIVFVSAAALTISLLWSDTYDSPQNAVRHALFNTVAIITTTGFATENFNHWNEFSKSLLLLLMFVGGCAGSTGGGIKVVRIMLFAKVTLLEIEQSFRPNVVRPLKIFGTRVETSLRHEVIVYIGLVLVIFVGSWMLLAAIEPDQHWVRRVADTTGGVTEVEVDRTAEKLLDCASAVAATINNVGPGLGVLGPHSNYAIFSPQGKLLLSLLMLLGRLELFAILVLFVPAFWRLH